MRCLLPLLLSLPLAAFDLVDCDLRLSGGPAGGDVDLGVPGTVAMDGSRGCADLVLGADLVLVGVVAGAGAAVERRDGSGWERTTTIGRVFAGPSLGVGPVGLELTGAYGRGRERLQAPDGSSDRAPVGQVGVDAVATFSLAHLVVGAGAGLARDTADHGGATGTVRSDSWHLAGIVGWRF